MLDFLWHSVFAWIGLGGVAIVGLVAVAFIFPQFRLLAVEIAAAVVAATAIYAKGASDARRRERLLQKAAEDRAVASGQADRAAAQRDAASGVRDGFDTDDK